jgi:hypothetical protein
MTDEETIEAAKQPDRRVLLVRNKWVAEEDAPESGRSLGEGGCVATFGHDDVTGWYWIAIDRGRFVRSGFAGTGEAAKAAAEAAAVKSGGEQ